jgi:capsular polysaccharide biosynthesis protein
MLLRGGETVELQEYLHILKKRWLLIFVITLTAILLSGVVSRFIIKPIYKADISVILGNVSTGTDGSNQKIDYSDVMMYQMLVKTYSELAKSRTVAENAINSLQLDIKPEELEKMISVSPKSDTEFLTISVKSKDAQQAMSIANQLAKSLKQVSINIKKMDNVQILDSAELPTEPYSPNLTLNISVAFLLSLIVSISLVFLLEYLDNTIKTEEDIERLLHVPVIGIIPSNSEVK